MFESASRIGGHTATVDVELGTKRYAVDTGFIVYNDWTYPGFIELMDRIGMKGKATSMSFSVSDALTGLEYAGSNLDTLFAQRRNLVSPRFLGMIRDILRFNRESIADLESDRIAGDTTVREYLERNGYGAAFRDQYLVPMGSAIWSADTDAMLDFPLQFFVRFFRNHGLLSVKNRPQWRVIEGGSREYLTPLTAGFKDNIRCNAKITGIRRHNTYVEITSEAGVERFDQVVLACHSDQALALLEDPTTSEREILSAIPYQDNEVVLHTDTRMLPENRKTWSSWNYHLTSTDQRAIVTYNMNILQGIQAPETFCVTLNHTGAINPSKILGRFNYAHPMFTLAGMKAQERWNEINQGPTWFCGAYWRNGFHEDGVHSARRVADAISSMQENRLELGSAA